nr:translation initiation factor IF-2-like [Equus asinus]
MPLGGRSSRASTGFGRGAPGSLRRLVWPRRAPPATPGIQCLFPCAPPRARSSAGGRCGLVPSPEGPLPGGRPRIRGREPAKELRALPLAAGRGGPGGCRRRSLVRRAAGGRARARRGGSCGLCAPGRRPRALGAEGLPAAPASLRGGRRQLGTTPHFVLVFRFICAPFSFLSPPEKGKANKRVSLFLFRACKVKDI